MQEHGAEPIIPFSCVLERKLADMPEDEAAKYCEENKLQRQVRVFFSFLERKVFVDLCFGLLGLA